MLSLSPITPQWEEHIWLKWNYFRYIILISTIVILGKIARNDEERLQNRIDYCSIGEDSTGSFKVAHCSEIFVHNGCP